MHEWINRGGFHRKYNLSIDSQGIGRLAFDFVKQYCKENEADSFVCHCLPENWNARKFYDKMGGKVIGEDMDNEESWMNSVIYRFMV